MVIILSLPILACAGLTIYACQSGRCNLKYIFKPLSTFLIIVMALTLPGTHPPIYRVLIVTGLVFSLAGDVLLALPIDKFVLGLASFLVALLFYSAAFIIGADLHLRWLLPLLLTVLVVSVILWPKLGKYRVPVALYELVMVTMVWRALAHLESVDDASSMNAAAGALLFMLSDSLLAINRFRFRIRYAEVFILGSYYLAQWLIALSV